MECKAAFLPVAKAVPGNFGVWALQQQGAGAAVAFCANIDTPQKTKPTTPESRFSSLCSSVGRLPFAAHRAVIHSPRVILLTIAQAIMKNILALKQITAKTSYLFMI